MDEGNEATEEEYERYYHRFRDIFQLNQIHANKVFNYWLNSLIFVSFTAWRRISVIILYIKLLSKRKKSKRGIYILLNQVFKKKLMEKRV